jgi:E3 ubiquitin-protein ligase listerin
LFQRLVLAFVTQFQSLLDNPTTDLLETIRRPLDLLSSILENSTQFSTSKEVCIAFVPEVFLLGHLLPEVFKSEDLLPINLARLIWTKWLAQASTDLQECISMTIRERLRDVLANVQTSPRSFPFLLQVFVDIHVTFRPRDILRLSSAGSSGVTFDVLEIVPPRDVLGKMLDALPAGPIDTSLATLDPLVPQDQELSKLPPGDGFFDSHGYSSYARITEIMLLAFTEDRPAAKKHSWALRHIISLSIYAEELLQLSPAPSAVFDAKLVPIENLQIIELRAHQVLAYALSARLDVNDIRWHERVVAASLPDAKSNVDGEIGQLIVDLVRKAWETDTFRESKVLHIILQHILSGATKQEADQWMFLARRLEQTGQHLTPWPLF